MKTYAYIRMSKDTSDAENQRFQIRKTLNGIEPDEWVIETVSGKKAQDDRQLGALIARLEKGDKIYLADVSRIGRTFFDTMESAARILKRKAGVIFCDPYHELKDDPGSEFYYAAMALGARLQRDFISASTRRALARKKAEGAQLGRPKGRTSINATLAAAEADIRALRKIGASAALIARRFKVARDTVRKFLKEKGI
jgi:DNA invertase Pin-like site-specific DNA recombinase